MNDHIDHNMDDPRDPVEMLRRQRTPNHNGDFWDQVTDGLSRTDAPRAGEAPGRAGVAPATSLASRRRPMLLAAAAALVAVAAIGGVFALNQDRTDPTERIVSNEGGDAADPASPRPTDPAVEPTPSIDPSAPAVLEPTVDPSIAALLESTVPDGARLLATGPDGSRYYGVDEEAPCGPGTTTLLGQDPFSPSLVFDPLPRPDTIGFVEALVVDEAGWAIISTNCNGSQDLWIGRMAQAGVLADASAPAIDLGGPVLLRQPFIDAERDLVVVSASAIDFAAGTNSAFTTAEVPFTTRERSSVSDDRSGPNTPEPGAVPNNARLLAHLPGYDVSFFGFAAPAVCTDPDAGKVMAVRDDGSSGPGVVGPQVQTTIRELIISPDETWGVIIAACELNSAAEIWPVSVKPPGLLFPVLDEGTVSTEGGTLVWTGLGLVSSWDAATVVLSNDLGAQLTVDVATGAVTVKQSESAIDPPLGEPGGRFGQPAGASPDGRYEYWNAEHPTGITGCEGESQSLWVHDTQLGTWQPAFIDEADHELDIIGNVTWSPFDETVAFTLSCEGYGTSVYRAERTGEGRLYAVESNVIPNLERGAVEAIEWLAPGLIDVTVIAFDGSEPRHVRFDAFNRTFEDPLPWLIVNGLGELAFTSSRVDDAQRLLDPVFGPGVSRGADCPTGSNQIISWSSLDLIFQDEVLEGWVYGGPEIPARMLETPSGVRIGMTETDMAAVYTGVVIDRTDLGEVHEFFFTVDAGTMSGLIDGDEVSRLSAGDSCSFR